MYGMDLSSMRGLDLFSGIGGITKALEGYVRPVAYCENDRYAQAVLLSRMADGSIPIAPIWDDVRTLKAEDIGCPIEIIYGGFPCQDISIAGRGEGLEGKRSGLFFEIVRLVSEIRPRFVFLENVPAIRFRGGNIVVGELARLGYDARWANLSAADVGANHERERWWLLAHSASVECEPGTKEQRAVRQVHEDGAERDNTCRSSETLADTASSRYREGQSKASGPLRIETWRPQPERLGSHVANATSNGLEAGRSPSRIQPAGSSSSSWWELEPNVGRVAHGIPFRVDRLKGLGNAVVPAQAREAFERLMGLKMIQ